MLPLPFHLRLEYADSLDNFEEAYCGEWDRHPTHHVLQPERDRLRFDREAVLFTDHKIEAATLSSAVSDPIPSTARCRPLGRLYQYRPETINQKPPTHHAPAEKVTSKSV